MNKLYLKMSMCFYGYLKDRNVDYIYLNIISN